MEEKQKPSCRFGSKCYRKNPLHFEEYSHPEKVNNESSFPLVKKAKIEGYETSGINSKNLKDVTKLKQTTLNFVKTVDNSNQEASKISKRTNAIKLNQESNRNNDGRQSKANSEKHINSKKASLRKKKQPEKNMKKPKFSEAISKDEVKKQSKVDTALSFEVKALMTKGNKMQEETPKNKNEGKNIISDSDENSNDSETEPSKSWVYVKVPDDTTPINFVEEDFSNKSIQEIIKICFLFDMPQDFYSFYEFCKHLNNIHPLKALEICCLNLVGPFDLMSGFKNFSVDKELMLCHWRFYYDPPEFQTVLTTESGFHIGYWRDDPKEEPLFLASNNPEKDCVFKIEAENIFGAVFHYLEHYVKTCDPFKKIKVSNIQNALSKWAEENKISLEKNSARMNLRKKKVVSKTFHKVGIVVPIEAKTELGYRPLIETEANLKRICKNIMEADDDSQREALFDNLQPLITAANIANDECDFGNSLELGIDLFCMGSHVFHETVEHLLTTAYSLLNRCEFEKIIRAHLNNRRKGKNLSVF